MLSEYFVLVVYKEILIIGAQDEVLGRKRFDVHPSQSEIIETIKMRNGTYAEIVKKYELI